MVLSGVGCGGCAVPPGWNVEVWGLNSFFVAVRCESAVSDIQQQRLRGTTREALLEKHVVVESELMMPCCSRVGFFFFGHIR